jgi:hypothetical protein
VSSNVTVGTILENALLIELAKGTGVLYNLKLVLIGILLTTNLSTLDIDIFYDIQI